MERVARPIRFFRPRRPGAPSGKTDFRATGGMAHPRGVQLDNENKHKKRLTGTLSAKGIRWVPWLMANLDPPPRRQEKAAAELEVTAAAQTKCSLATGEGNLTGIGRAAQ